MEKNYKKAPRTPYTPKITEDQKLLSDYLKQQIATFQEYNANIDNYEVKDRMAAENALFSLGDDIPALSMVARFYLLQRSVRTDRTSHQLVRATVSMLVANEDKDPTYFITSYVTGAGMGNIQIIPIDENGPVGRDTAMVSIRDWKMTDQWEK